MIDVHTHTGLSYCAEGDLSPKIYAKYLESDQTIESIYITDHGMAIYFPEEVAWSWEFITDSSIFDTYRDRGNRILAKHLEDLNTFSSYGIFPGIEVEMMNDGRLPVDDCFRDKLDVLIGSVHFLPVSHHNCHSENEIINYWKKHVFLLIEKGIDILGHPFRWLSNQVTVPEHLINEITIAAVANDVALELNSHIMTETADRAMITTAVNSGAKIAFGTDSHRRAEIGDFSYHLSILDQCHLSLSDLNLFIP